jgi:hypothetical protein
MAAFLSPSVTLVTFTRAALPKQHYTARRGPTRFVAQTSSLGDRETEDASTFETRSRSVRVPKIV